MAHFLKKIGTEGRGEKGFTVLLVPDQSQVVPVARDLPRLVPVANNFAQFTEVGSLLSGS